MRVPSEKGKGSDSTGTREKGAALQLHRHPYIAFHHSAETSVDSTHQISSICCHPSTAICALISQTHNPNWRLVGHGRNSLSLLGWEETRFQAPGSTESPPVTHPHPLQEAKCPLPRAEEKRDWQTYPSSADGQFTGERRAIKKNDTSLKNSQSKDQHLK